MPSAAGPSHPPPRAAPTPAPPARPPAPAERAGGWAWGGLVHEQVVGPGHPLHGRRKRRLGHKRRRRCCPGCPGGPTLSPAATAAMGEKKRAAHYPTARTCCRAAVQAVRRPRSPQRGRGRFHPPCHGRRPPPTCCSSPKTRAGQGWRMKSPPPPPIWTSPASRPPRRPRRPASADHHGLRGGGDGSGWPGLSAFPPPRVVAGILKLMWGPARANGRAGVRTSGCVGGGVDGRAGAGEGKVAVER